MEKSTLKKNTFKQNIFNNNIRYIIYTHIMPCVKVKITLKYQNIMLIICEEKSSKGC